jgi:hypothetical protein
MDTNRYERRSIRSIWTPGVGLVFFGGLLVGSVAMYLMDPRSGTRRRVVARDRVRSALHRYSLLSGKLLRHSRHKLEGAFAIATTFIRPEGEVSDNKIAARVRSALGRAIPHPRAIGVAVTAGRVTLRGTLPPHQAGLAVLATERVRGVIHIENLITPPLKPEQQPMQ